MFTVAVGFIVPRWFDVFVVPEKRDINSDATYAPQVTMSVLATHHSESDLQEGYNRNIRKEGEVVPQEHLNKEQEQHNKGQGTFM